MDKISILYIRLIPYLPFLMLALAALIGIWHVAQN
jgi:hypothetical protein